MFTRAIFAVLAVFLSASLAQAKGFYLGAYGGANWSDTNYSSPWVSFESDTGYVIGGVLGTNLDQVPGLAIEADLSFRSNPIDGVICYDPFSISDHTWGLLANAKYTFDTPKWPVHPYLLVGAGYASRTATVDDWGYEVSNDGFAWQLGAGVNTTVAPGIQLGVGYRYFDAPNLSAYGISDDGNSHAVVGSVTFTFD